MTTWAVPITWVNGVPTAAMMNTLRDNLIHLKGVVDAMTDNTSADTGTAMYLAITRAGASDAVLEGKVTGDAFPRIRARAGSGIAMGDGTAGPQVVASFGGGVLTFDRLVQASSLIKGFTKAGAMNDTDIPGYFAGSGSGLFGFDTTNSKMWARFGTNWKSVTFV